MLQIAIVENEEESAKLLADHLNLYQKEEKVSFKINFFSNGMDFIEEYKPVYDIVFMDIEMPHMDGLTATKKLREIDENVKLVFVTFLAQYAIKGYEVNAIDYIVKPIKYANLAIVMRKAIELIKRSDSFITVSSGDHGVKRLDVNDIIYLEVFNNNVVYHTSGGDIVVRETLANAEKALLGYGFSRCHRGYTVNLRYVTDVVQNEVMIGDKMLIISRHKKKEFLSDLTEFWGRGAR